MNDHAPTRPAPSTVCQCGWLRPVIALTTLGGTAPPEHVLPCYRCPQCGEWYIAGEISGLSDARIQQIRTDLKDPRQ